jgi:hypothetical protein
MKNKRKNRGRGQGEDPNLRYWFSTVAMEITCTLKKIDFGLFRNSCTKGTIVQLRQLCPNLKTQLVSND